MFKSNSNFHYYEPIKQPKGFNILYRPQIRYGIAK